MSETGLILVDSSVWVRFFRESKSVEGYTLDKLLSAGVIATCHPIRAEIVAGACTKREFDRLRELFETLELLT